MNQMSFTKFPRKSSRGLFVTGSDTEIGKTFVACAIVRSLRRAVPRVGVYKPVASGVCSVESSDAFQLLLAAGAPREQLERVCPQSFSNPLAPMEAAKIQNLTVDTDQILAGFAYWTEACEFTVVEGAGGLLSPIAEQLNNAELAEKLGLPIVVVVPNRLGCVNQAMLVLEVARLRGLQVAALVLNQTHERPNDLSTDTNYQLLRHEINRGGFSSTPTYDFKYQQIHLDLMIRFNS